ncbi:hypothetical protein [Spiroplasma apis]|uniref:Uncharacterized protein n=1 Tax=Spiroplasma apis B31 TaxID=1276258 RepID=V5RJD9_SPIAP|nr:hypothetical protein [Spiroplasma apis]AHB36226.1 hypothetical protein SAPIS_v1c03800 [Spiroplasma apis B31]
MKKLMSMLGVLSLTGLIGTQIVSCSTKNNTKVDPTEPEKPEKPGTGEEESIDKLIEEFKSDINKIVSDELNATKSNLFELESHAQNSSFLKNDVLKTIKGNNITDQQKEALIKDLKNKINYNIMDTKIQKLKSNPAYDILLRDIEKVLQRIEIPTDTIKIKYTEDKSTIKISNITFDYSIVTNFKNKDRVTEEYKVNNSFNYSQTNNEKITVWWENLMDELANVIYDKSDITHLTSKNLQVNDVNDKFFTNNNKYISNYINNGKSAETILKLIDNNNELSQFGKLSFKDQKDIFSRVEWNLQLSANNNSTFYNWKDKDFNGRGLYDLIFRNKSDLITEQMGEKDIKVENALYYHLNRSINYYTSGFKNNVEKLAKKLKIDNTTSYFNSAIKFGYIFFSGLKLTIGENYTQELPEFKLFTSYSIDETENIYVNNRGFVKSPLNKSIYYNALKGINAYKEIFGIKPTKYQYALAAFTGKSEKIKENLWDLIYKLAPSKNEGKIYMDKKLSDIMSLDLNQLNKYKDYLLMLGNQSTFKWKFDRDYHIVMKADDKINRGIYFFRYIVNDDLKNEPNGAAAGETGINIRFNLDFLNLNFYSTEGWRWQPKYPSAFERYDTAIFEQAF